jgi:hypothetical protein
MMASPDIGFAALESQRASDGIRRGIPLDNVVTKEGPALIAVKDGLRALLIPVPTDVATVTDRRSAGVQLYRIQLIDAGRTVDYVCLECLKSHLHDLFDLLIAEVIKLAAGDSERPDIICTVVLDRWRELLEREPRSAPSAEVLRGIWGELWHVRAIARAGRTDLRYWTGHLRGIWDVVTEDNAIEIKTITNRSAWRVSISSEYQLEPGAGNLLLSVVRVDVGGDEGESVASLIEDLYDAGVDPAELVPALTAYGLDWHQVAPTRAVRFKLLDHRAWKVGSDFPRIVPSSFIGGAIPENVSRIGYDIDLTTRLDAALTADDWADFLAGIAK